ncbi:HIT family protein [Ligilactobacillus sp. WILCCON 0076]|uniref:HIT family protein n=1 Tax=Ligilactobacillus ubinensis TaxID=2876789 RepID=A0A9X2FK22_9LACO|nr:HIT family protein [Ligilactobacillus ubinensis]MCP0886750.1 HIT family protein [Ligilactobacillus ubinensis]
MEDCIFCKIIAGEIPSKTIYEDDIVKAFLDITQVTAGHTLVVPKKHVPDIFAYDEHLAADVFSRIPKIARAIKAANPEVKGLNLVNNNGAIAYQSVFHSHFHLIPRFSKDDDFSMTFTDNSENYDDAALQLIAKSIETHVED